MLERACDRYLDHLRVERNLSPRTLEAYANDLRGLRAALAKSGVVEAEQVSSVHVARWLAGLADGGKKASSQGRALSAARRFFAYLVRTGDLRASPASDVVGPRR